MYCKYLIYFILLLIYYIEIIKINQEYFYKKNLLYINLLTICKIVHNYKCRLFYYLCAGFYEL